MNRAVFSLVVFALTLVLRCPTAIAHSHRKLNEKPVARPGILKGFQLGPASGSSGDDVVAQEVGQYADALQRSIRNSGFQGNQRQLIARLKDDGDLGVHLAAEALVFECRSMLPSKSPQVSAAVSSVGADLAVTAPDPLVDQAFVLASRPAAKNKIWLDFKGSVIEGTAWNSISPNITTPPYSRDDDTTTFNVQERTDIVAIWRAVSEDYSPFNVDVTTIPPTGPPSTYVRVIIGGDGAWYGSPGGLSYVGVFGTNSLTYNPAFVFPKMLGPNHPKYMWEAISHEVGHNMGLYHDGDQTTPYYQGHGIWAPIMGVGYYKPLTQFSKGEYAGANQLQDDVAIIAQKLGYAPKVNGDSIATATALPAISQGTTASSVAYGVVAKAGVAEFFKFQASAGSATIKAQLTPSFANANGGVDNRADLDVRVMVYDSSGAAIATFDPPSVNDASTLGVADSAVTLPAGGVYYMAVAGAGSGDPRTTGYSDYGSIGRFAVSLAYPAADPLASTDPEPPSPPPSPASSPDTAQQTMDVSLQVTSTLDRTLAAYTCSAVVSVQLTDGTPVGGAVVVGRWASAPAVASYVTVARGQTRRNGAAVGTFTSASPPLPRSSSSCVFIVSAVRKTGLELTRKQLPRLSVTRGRRAAAP